MSPFISVRGFYNGARTPVFLRDIVSRYEGNVKDLLDSGGIPSFPWLQVEEIIYFFQKIFFYEGKSEKKKDFLRKKVNSLLELISKKRGEKKFCVL